MNQYTAITNPAQDPTYDDDGNMLNDGTWTFTWDAENRMKSATNGTQTLEFTYDYLSRRVEKKIYSGVTLSTHERFIYNNFKAIEKLDALDSNAIKQKFIWSGEKLLSMSDSNGTYYYLQDANKNIGQLIDSSGAIKANYEYSPFGKLTVANDTLANPFRFSSEYFDTETGLVYYNYRYYSPDLGRWLSRDPIEEQGGWSLYGMIANNCISFIDYLGLDAVTIGPFTINYNRSDMTEGEKKAEDAHEEQHRSDFLSLRKGWKKEQDAFKKEQKVIKEHIRKLKQKKACWGLSKAEENDLKASESREKVAKDLSKEKNAKEYWNETGRRWYQKRVK